MSDHDERPNSRPIERTSIHHRIAFWLGAIAIMAGVLMHGPDYLRSGEMHYRMVGMGMSSRSKLRVKSVNSIPAARQMSSMRSSGFTTTKTSTPSKW